MGGIVKGIRYWINYLRKYFLDTRVVRGQMSVGYGDNIYVIDAPQGTPIQVSVSLEEPDDANTVCMGNINLAGAKLLPDGFVLYTRIQSNTCIVKWIVEFDPDTLTDDDVV